LGHFFNENAFSFIMKTWRWAVETRLSLQRDSDSSLSSGEDRVSSPWKTRGSDRKLTLLSMPFNSKTRRTQRCQDAPSTISSWKWPTDLAEDQTILLTERLDNVLIELSSILYRVAALSPQISGPRRVAELISISYEHLWTALMRDSCSSVFTFSLISTMLHTFVVTERERRRQLSATVAPSVPKPIDSSNSVLLATLQGMGFSAPVIEMAFSASGSTQVQDLVDWMLSHATASSPADESSSSRPTVNDEVLVSAIDSCFAHELTRDADGPATSRVSLRSASCILDFLSSCTIRRMTGLSSLTKSVAQFFCFALFDDSPSVSAPLCRSKLCSFDESKESTELVHGFVERMSQAIGNMYSSIGSQTKSPSRPILVRLFLLANVVLEFASSCERARQLLCRDNSIVPAVVKYLENPNMIESPPYTKTLLHLSRSLEMTQTGSARDSEPDLDAMTAANQQTISRIHSRYPQAAFS
jgi:hypothetical protein